MDVIGDGDLFRDKQSADVFFPLQIFLLTVRSTLCSWTLGCEQNDDSLQ